LQRRKRRAVMRSGLTLCDGLVGRSASTISCEGWFPRVVVFDCGHARHPPGWRSCFWVPQKWRPPERALCST